MPWAIVWTDRVYGIQHDLTEAACGTINKLTANSFVWSISQLLFDQSLRLLLSNKPKAGLKHSTFRFSPDYPTGCLVNGLKYPQCESPDFVSQGRVAEALSVI